ncbi:uncharacterized protein LOC141701843 [Apium graveolens]|uniref:uncharacterized protein LOC141701843 n=1 Tax=Apium graveolens TaxID=4045 RepID=UPI003D7AE891
MTDYFSKWIEAEAFKQVTSKKVISFIKRNILCKFGVPSETICDNGSQFISDKTEMFCKHWNINLIKSTPRYPQANGQAETTPKMSTGQTPYSLVYGTEAVIPTEVMIPTTRYGLLMGVVNNTELSHDKETVDELREIAKIHLASYQQRVANTYKKHVHIRTFRVGDMVLRKMFQNTMDMTAGKFSDTWEGPYFIDVVVGHGAYQLSTMDGIQIPRSWNALDLKLYHV